MKAPMTVDVVIITKNRPEKLFRSVCSLLSNTVLPKQIVIIDGSDFFETVSYRTYREYLCKRVGVKLVYKTQLSGTGISFARNQGLRLCVSDIIAFIDDDEVAPVEWIATMVKIFYEHPSRMAVTGPRRPIYTHNYWNKVWDKILDDEQGFIGYRNYIFGDNACYRKNFIVRNKLSFDPRMKIASEDVYFSYRILQTGARVYFSDALYVYHDFRTDFLNFMRQWFFYGVGTYEFHYYHVLHERLDVGHLGQLWDALVTSTRWTRLIPRLDTPMFFALLCRDGAFILGYTITLVKTLFYRQ